MSTKEFIISLDDIWPGVYTKRGRATDSLRKYHLEGVDFRAEKVVEGGKNGRPKILYYLTEVSAKRFKIGQSTHLRRGAPRRHLQGTYFIACPGANAIKIGLTLDLDSRIASLRTSNPLDIELIAFIPTNLEHELHAQLAHLRLRGEWFHLTNEVLAVAQALVNRHGGHRGT